MDKFGLSNIIIEQIKTLFKTFPEIEKVTIFGSRATGNYKKASDIDFAIFGNITDKKLRHIAAELYELPTPYKFDVVNYSDIENPKLKQNIDNFGIEFYQK